MIGLEMSCSCYHGLSLSIRHKEAFSTIFQKTEAFLNNGSNYGAKKFFKKMMEDHDVEIEYRDLIDMLFCELFPEHKPGCIAYYADKGPKLMFLISEKATEIFDEYMVNALKMMLLLNKAKADISWEDFYVITRQDQQPNI